MDVFANELLIFIRASQVWIYVSNRRNDFIFVWLDAKKVDGLFDRAAELSCSFRNLNPVGRHIRISGNKTLVVSDFSLYTGPSLELASEVLDASIWRASQPAKTLLGRGDHSYDSESRACLRSGQCGAQ